ncbi:hypothetical protein FS749_012735 [Ceratobasidium sp. UAMH 11750]|nr:hypothetical protein FS749_012735 [Ceratobasidium sp. UAMH 11750]
MFIRFINSFSTVSLDVIDCSRPLRHRVPHEPSSPARSHMSETSTQEHIHHHLDNTHGPARRIIERLSQVPGTQPPPSSICVIRIPTVSHLPPHRVHTPPNTHHLQPPPHSTRQDLTSRVQIACSASSRTNVSSFGYGSLQFAELLDAIGLYS